MKLADVEVPMAGLSSSTRISLVKLLKQPISDLQGYFTTEFGEPVFSISSVVLADGTDISVGGEHDLAYLEELPGISEEVLDALVVEQNE